MSVSADIEKYRDTGLMPFQAELIRSVLSRPVPVRYLLVAPPGTGKTRTAMDLAKRIAVANPKHRILFIGPRVMASMIQHHLAQVIPISRPTVVTRRVLRELQDTTNGNEPIWPAPFAAVMTMDTARQDDVRNLLRTVNWDLVVLEELHMFTRARWTVLKTILSQEVFQRVLMITDGIDLKGIASLLRNATKTEWRATDLKDWNGQPLIAEPKFVTVEYKRGDDEVSLIHSVIALTRQLVPSPTGQLIKAMLLRQASSSPLALERTVRQLRNNLAHSKSEIFMASEIRRIMEDSTEDLGADAIMPKTSSHTLWRNRSNALILLNNLIEQVDSVATDKKRDALEGLLQDLVKNNNLKNLYACLFCSFGATANYLQSVLVERGFKTWLFTGAQTPQQLDIVLNGFRREGGMLIATPLALTGINLRDVQTFIHYDPSSESELPLRISRNPKATHYLLKDTSGALAEERATNRPSKPMVRKKTLR